MGKLVGVIVALAVLGALFGGGDDQDDLMTIAEVKAQEEIAWAMATRALVAAQARGCGSYTIEKKNRSRHRATYLVTCGVPGYDRITKYDVDFDMNVISKREPGTPKRIRF